MRVFHVFCSALTSGSCTYLLFLFFLFYFVLFFFSARRFRAACDLGGDARASIYICFFDLMCKRGGEFTRRIYVGILIGSVIELFGNFQIIRRAEIVDAVYVEINQRI